MTVIYQKLRISHLRGIKSPLRWWVRLPGGEHTYKFRTKREAQDFIDRVNRQS
jgi:hypothetical protein